MISESEMETSIRDPVEDRLTLAEKNERLQSQLKVLFIFEALPCSFFKLMFVSTFLSDP